VVATFNFAVNLIVSAGVVYSVHSRKYILQLYCCFLCHCHHV